MTDLDFLIDEFKWFHQHPELSFQEHQTQTHIAAILDDHGVAYKKIADTGIVVHINAEKFDYPCIAIRADIDALPIKENSGVAYQSLHDGIMHAHYVEVDVGSVHRQHRHST